MTVPLRATMVASVALTAGCSQPSQAPATAGERSPELASTPPNTPFVWPASLRVIGEGYPASGDTCRRIGESAATVDLLDDSADLVGCPAGDKAAIAALRGRPLAEVDGVALLSVPHVSPPLADSRDSRVAGTRFHAKGLIGCKGPALPSSKQCEAGVVRREDRSADVTVLFEASEGPTLRLDAQGRTMDPGATSEIKGETVVVTRDGVRFEIPTALLWGG